MKSKQVLILIGILAFLVAGIAIKQAQKRPEIATQEYTSLDLSFDQPRVAKITVQIAKENKPQIVLTKDKNLWRVSTLWSARADQKKIDDFLSGIHKAEGEVRASSKDLWKDFGIDDKQGVVVTLASEDGKPLREFVLGVKKAGPGSLFVRKKESDAVYLTDANLFAMMGVYNDPAANEPQPDFWLSRNLAVFETPTVNRIELINSEMKGSNSFRLVRQDGKWRFDPADLAFEVSTEKVTQYLDGLKTYPAQNALDGKAKDYGFSNPKVVIRIGLDGGQELQLRVGAVEDKDKNNYYVQTAGEPVVFILSKFYVENLAPDVTHFFPDNLLQVDAAKTEKLVLHADKTEMKFEPMSKKWAALTSYLDGLKNFRVDKVVDAKPRFGRYWVEIQRQGQAPLVMDATDVGGKDHKDYVVQKRGTSQVFGISETLFKQLFDNPGRLEAPKQ